MQVDIVAAREEQRQLAAGLGGQEGNRLRLGAEPGRHHLEGVDAAVGVEPGHDAAAARHRRRGQQGVDLEGDHLFRELFDWRWSVRFWSSVARTRPGTASASLLKIWEVSASNWVRVA